MNEITEKISSLAIVPVVVIENSGDAVYLAEALCDGGLPCAEITFRTAAAYESIKKISEAFPDMLIGAGTVLTIEQLDSAVSAGADFIVSPGFDAEIVDYCIKNDIPVFPGCVTPTEIAEAVKRGLETVKFFPAQQFGGISTIKALSAPYPGLKFMPTGGINKDNVKDYLLAKQVIACGGSWMCKSDMIKAHEFEKIMQLTKDAVMLAKEIRG